MQRASLALVVDDVVWLVDPLDSRDLDDVLQGLGTVAEVAGLGSEYISVCKRRLVSTGGWDIGKG